MINKSRYFAAGAIFRVVNLTICLSISACGRRPEASSKLLSDLGAEQSTNHFAIGYKEDEAFEYIDPATKGAFIRVPRLIQPTGVQSIDLKAANGVQSSSDGRWIASCSGDQACKVSERDNPAEQFVVSRKHALTPLYLSPDGRFAFLVEGAPNWRFPRRCSLEDERDVTVYDIVADTSGVITTVCGGFPYGSLRWYEFGPT